MIPVVNVFKCVGCGVCVKRCPPKIMGLINGKSALLAQLCEECGICAEACPNQAILFELPAAAAAGIHEAYTLKR